MIEAFIRESVEKKAEWKRIRILGGEPTLHSHIFDIIELLEDYRSVHNPDVRIVLCTNYFGRKVHEVLEKLPGGIDRIFQYHLGRESLTDQSDIMADKMSAFCRLCGHFGFQWPVRKEKISPSWQKAYLNFPIQVDDADTAMARIARSSGLRLCQMNRRL